MKQTVLAGAALAVLLAACAGGPLQPPGPGGTTTLPPGGIYKGTATAHGSAILLMLFDGTAYLFYGDASSPGGEGGGVVVVTNGAQSNAGQFASTSAQNYSLRPGRVSPAAFAANFARAPAVDGTVTPTTPGGENLAFSATAIQLLGAMPAGSTVAGLYSGQGGSTKGLTKSQITVTDDGYLAGTTASGCVFKGTVTPRTGVNAYDVSVTFGPAPCPAPGATVAGNAVLDGARLLAALPSADRSDVFAFDGRK